MAQKVGAEVELDVLETAIHQLLPLFQRPQFIVPCI